ncbi:hypothetical protein ACQKPT_07430 [Pseudomonas monteilii]|uniref:hypothetical protein n=1 Tax=Pseudomonas monteilii TaxID=76759 RepID=UPI003CFF5391
MKDIAHDQAMVEVLRADPFYAKALLDDVLRGGDCDELAILLRQIQPLDSGFFVDDAESS